MKRSDNHNSFYYAWRGIVLLFREELNFQIHVVTAAVVLLMAALLELPSIHIAILALVIGLVLVLEVINSVLERMADAVKPRLHQYFGDIKDIMAGGVCIAAFIAVLVGILIFAPQLPRILSVFIVK